MPRNPTNKRKLSHLTVTKALPREVPYLIWDLEQRGLALRVETSGYRAYKVIYAFHGRTRWLHLAAADAIGVKDARTLARKAMAKVAEGIDPAAERRAERGEGTFEQLANRYLEYARKKNRSWPQARALVERFLLPRWGKLPAATIQRADVKTMFAAITAPVIANQTLAAASAIFTWAIREDVLKDNPCKLVEMNATRSRERILSTAELPQFWAAFDSAGLVAGAALKCLLLLGQRPGEVAHMRHEHIEGGWWTMPGAPDPKAAPKATEYGCQRPCSPS